MRYTSDNRNDRKPDRNRNNYGQNESGREARSFGKGDGTRFGKGDGTVITREYPGEWKPGDEPYYPVNNDKNTALYEKYKELADAEKNVIFGGRLGVYKYYDMDKVIASALELAEEEL